jgi:hypothetical protein
MLSSPVTAGSSTASYLDDDVGTGRTGEPYFQAAWVHVPVQILPHANDPCTASPPSGAQRFDRALAKLPPNGPGVETFFHQMKGGFVQTGGDPCEALSFHGFLGIEPKTVRRIAYRMTQILADLEAQFPGDTGPVAGDGSLGTLTQSASTHTASATLDLTTIAHDADGDTLTFTLPHPHSSRGAVLSLSGSTVTYTATSFAGPVVNDSFVYVVSDGKGKKSFGVVSVVVDVN